jgi:hypothetical protein
VSDWPSISELEELDASILEAFKSGDESGINVLGYGEISAVVRLHSQSGDFACKRLPPFPEPESLKDYQNCFRGYLRALGERGTKPVETSLMQVGESTLYCVQPLVAGENLAVNAYKSRDTAGRLELIDQIVERICSTVTPQIGLDGQLSNWVAHEDGTLRYIDVTTPFLRDENGKEQLDADVFLAALPWALRGTVKRLMLKSIIQVYYDVRSTIRDLLANLHKERLTEELPQIIERVNAVVEPAFTAKEIKKYYASDARTWALLLSLRRADRGWQRKVRRRSYPFLLPGNIAR